jgi:hypothetical protein
MPLYTGREWGNPLRAHLQPLLRDTRRIDTPSLFSFGTKGIQFFPQALFINMLPESALAVER